MIAAITTSAIPAWAADCHYVTLDDGTTRTGRYSDRVFRRITPAHWALAPGRRFVLEADRDAMIKAAMAKFHEAAARYRAAKGA